MHERIRLRETVAARYDFECTSFLVAIAISTCDHSLALVIIRLRDCLSPLGFPLTLYRDSIIPHLWRSTIENEALPS